MMMNLTPNLSVDDLSAAQQQQQEYPGQQFDYNHHQQPSSSSFSTHMGAEAAHSAAVYNHSRHHNSSATGSRHHQSAATMQPMPPQFTASPSKNPCMVRVNGVQGATNSRYRNDPYTCSVLPPLHGNSGGGAGAGGLASRRLAPLPASLHVSRRNSGSGSSACGGGAPRAKVDILRAQEFAVDGGVSNSPDSTVDSRQRYLPTPGSSVTSSSTFTHHAAPQQQQEQPFMQHANTPAQHYVPSAYHRPRPEPRQNLNHPAPLASQAMQSATVQHHPNYHGPAWAMVRLKHEVLLYNLSFPALEGDFVVLEGDRGENIGRVNQLISEQPQHPVQCSICRLADDSDIEAVKVQRDKEEAAKHFAQGVSDALKLGIRVVDTEFQTDGNKLTVYFTARRQIDFRRLQRQMFKQYRCRIWLVNWTDVVKAQ